METKINIAEILKDKPKGTKLYSYICAGECILNEVSENAIYVDMYNKERFWYFSVYGTIYAFPNGGVLLYPSYEMRDWEKFAWKKGDVLVHKDGTVHIIFEGFEDDMYRTFKGKYYLWEENGHIEQFDDHQHCMETSVFIKANDDAKTYINTIKERLGGKLNRETLEIEPAQPEFKDGEILLCKKHFPSIFILDTNRNYEMRSYVRFNTGRGSIDYDMPVYNLNTDGFRYATEEEKKELFDALAKEGKAWDAEKKEVVDLEPKCELKPFDKVLCRDDIDEEWHIDLFESTQTDNSKYNYKCMVNIWKHCIPYEGNEHLLGTTKDMEE